MTTFAANFKTSHQIQLIKWEEHLNIEEQPKKKDGQLCRVCFLNYHVLSQ